MSTRRDLLRAAAAFALAREPLEAALQEDAPLRDAYDLAPSVRYLNHASIGTVPRAVREALGGYLKTCEANPWLYVWSDAWTEVLEAAHANVATAMGCGADDLAVVRNTTEAFSLFAQGLELGPGDVVAFSQLNHVGASACWEAQAARRGFRLQQLEVPEADLATLSVDDVVAAHVDALEEGARVLVLPHVDNIFGLRHPVPEIAAAARARGVRWVLVDAAQTVGMLSFRAEELGADAVATSAHKWLQAPKGTGLVYLSRALRAELKPMIVTWGQWRWRGTARAFADYGTRDLPSLLALGDAARFQRERAGLGRGAHDRALFERARERCDAEPRLVWRSPRDLERGAALYAVGVLGADAAELAEGLFRDEGFVVRPFSRAGGGHLRVSPNTLNSGEELDAFFDELVARLA